MHRNGTIRLTTGYAQHQCRLYCVIKSPVNVVSKLEFKKKKGNCKKKVSCRGLRNKESLDRNMVLPVQDTLHIYEARIERKI